MITAQDYIAGKTTFTDVVEADLSYLPGEGDNQQLTRGEMTLHYTKDAGSFSANDTFRWEGFDLRDGFDDALADSIRSKIYLNYEPGNEDKIVKKCQ